MALTQAHFRFGVDDGTEAAHTWYAAEDTNPTAGDIPLDTTFLLRFCVQANATGLTNVDNNFEYRLNGGTWTQITTTSSVVRAVAATALTNGGNCTKRLSGTGTFESSGAGQTEDGISGGTANDIVASGNSETECGLQILSADVAHNDVIDFRLTRDASVLLDTYAVNPSYTVVESAPEITGTLSATLGAATLASSGTADVAGALASTLGAATLASAGAVTIDGTLETALEGATLASAGTVEDPSGEISGGLEATLGAATLASAGTVAIAGTVAATLAPATLSSTGAAPIAGALAATLDDAALASSGTTPVAATLEHTLGAMTLAAAGTVPITAALTRTLDALTLEAGDATTTPHQALRCAMCLLFSS